jgi:hypothetical protein
MNAQTALVRDEQQHLVERGVGVDVAGAGRELLHPTAHVAEERLGVEVALGVGGGLEVAQVVVDRELDVHVQHPPAGQEEGDVGDRAPGDAGLLAVGDAFDHARQAQDVVGHALAPLAARLGAGQGLPQVAGGLGEGARGRRGVLEPGDQLTVLLGGVLLELHDDVAQALQLRGEALHALLERGGAQVELASAARHRVAQLLAGHLGGHVGGRADRVLPLHAQPGLELGGLLRQGARLLLEGHDHALVGGGRAGTGGAGPDDVRQGEDGSRAEDGEEGGGDHGKSVRRGCDSGRGCRGKALVTARLRSSP